MTSLLACSGQSPYVRDTRFMLAGELALQTCRPDIELNDCLAVYETLFVETGTSHPDHNWLAGIDLCGLSRPHGCRVKFQCSAPRCSSVAKNVCHCGKPYKLYRQPISTCGHVVATTSNKASRQQPSGTPTMCRSDFSCGSTALNASHPWTPTSGLEAQQNSLR